jgi:hypothetical protein
MLGAAALVAGAVDPPRQRLAQQPHRRTHAVAMARTRQALNVRRSRQGSRRRVYRRSLIR